MSAVGSADLISSTCCRYLVIRSSICPSSKVASRQAPTLINGWPASVPVGLPLEGVAGAQDQRLFHMPTNNLESNRKAIFGFAARQCQRWMPAHIKRRGEADPCLNHRRRATSCRQVCHAGCGAVHDRHDQQIDIAEEGVELAAKDLPAK